MMVELDVLIEEAKGLEPLPASATRLASILAAPEWDLDEVVRVVCLDQALTARLLRAANSAIGGARVSITTVEAAVMRLGPGTVPSLALGPRVRQRMEAAYPELGLSEGELWRHSVAAALAADSARKYCSAKIPVESFPAALLHDIGTLVLCQFLEPALLRCLKNAFEGSPSERLDAESRILEVHHAELGGLVVQHWGLPESFVRGLTFHHNPREAPLGEAGTICYVIHVADLVAKKIGHGQTDVEIRFEDHEPAMERLGLDAAGFEGLCAEVVQRFDTALTWFA